MTSYFIPKYVRNIIDVEAMRTHVIKYNSTSTRNFAISNTSVTDTTRLTHKKNRWFSS